MNRKLKIAGIVVACVLVVLIALPLFVNVNSFKPTIESQAASALGRPVTLGDLSLSIFSGSIKVDNISIADDPAFSSSPFITAKSLKVGVELMPLIFSKKLEVTGIELKEPQITLLKGSNNRWNFSSLGGNNAAKTAKPAESGSAAPGDVTIGKLEISDGKITVGHANSVTKPQVYDKVDLTVKNFSLTSQFPLELSAGLPGGGKANIEGKAGPINSQDSAKTPFDLSLKVKGLDLAGSQLFDPSAGIGGNLSLEGTTVSDGKTAKGAGTVTCEKFKFSPKGTPSPKDLTVKYAVDTNLATESGTITQGDIKAGNVAAQLTGGFQTQGEARVLNMRLNAPSMSVDELESMLPALGVVLPSGSQLKGGTLSADLAITGPVDKAVISGPVRLSNSKLAGFDLGSKLAALEAFTGKTGGSSDTTIQNASLNAHVTPGGTTADTINLTVPAIGVITGAGAIDPSGTLNFKMLANLQGGMATGLTQKVGFGGGGGSSAIPFSIQGTTSNPKFVPDVSGIATSMATSALKGALSGGGTKGSSNPLSGLFHKKK
jgi:AsmA protein